MAGHGDEAPKAGRIHHQRFWIIAYFVATILTFFVVGVDIKNRPPAPIDHHTTWDLYDLVPSHRRPQLIGWGGSQLIYPGHTLASYKQVALDLADGFSVEVWQTKDGLDILSTTHDLSRIVNNATGFVWEKTQAELVQLDLGPKYGPMTFPNGSGIFPNMTKMTTLKTAIAFAKENNLDLLVDVRVTGREPMGFEQLVGHVLGQIILGGYENRTMITSRESRVSTLVKAVSFSIATGLTVDPLTPTVSGILTNTSVAFLSSGDWDAVFVSHTLMTKDLLTATSDVGKNVYIMTLPTELAGLEALMNLGTYGIVTRYLENAQMVWFRVSKQGVEPKYGVSPPKELVEASEAGAAPAAAASSGHHLRPATARTWKRQAVKSIRKRSQL